MHPGGRIAEIGTGTGVGVGWLADGLQQGATLLTVDIDPQRAEAATKVFLERDDVTVKCGDWKEAFVDEEPFDLLFVDGGGPDMLELSTATRSSTRRTAVVPTALLAATRPRSFRDPWRWRWSAV